MFLRRLSLSDRAEWKYEHVYLSQKESRHTDRVVSFLFFKPTQATPVKKIYKETISPSSSFQSWVAGSFNFGIIDGAGRAH